MWSFLPLRNPIGFGVSDFVELGLAAFLLALILLRRRVLGVVHGIAPRTGWSIALFAALPIVLRLVLLNHHPVPVPDVYDEFSHLLVADTLRHFRLSNPMHPLHRFFETFFVLQEPTYSSIYPLGQGLVLAIGRALFGIPWAGVIIATAAFCGLSYWMLRAWVEPVWAFLGGMLAVIQFGPLNPWMNNYWGGSLSAVAGCLVFGSLPRVRDAWRLRDGVCLGAGLAIHLLTRPFESIFLILAAASFFIRIKWSRRLVNAGLAAAGFVVVAVCIVVMQNHSVTGSWTTLPYQLSQFQYGVPASLSFQPPPVPHRDLTPQQQMQYKMQLAFRADRPETLRSYFARFGYRLRFLRFFVLAPLYVALIAFIPAMREFRFAWVGATVLLFALGTNFFPAFQFHYLGAITCLFLLMSVVGLQRLPRLAGWIIVALCLFQFSLWYGVHLFEDSPISVALRPYEAWNTINHGNPERRIAVNQQLAKQPGQQVVFVRYWPNHIFQDEWVYNEADIDHARVIWARDLGTENEKLLSRYPGSKFWLLEPDASPPGLRPYEPEPIPEPASPPVTPAITSGKSTIAGPQQRKPTLRFEDVK
jgi:hypothetical protein